MKVSSNMCFCVDKLRLDMFWYFVTSFSLLAKAILNALDLELLGSKYTDVWIKDEDMEDTDYGSEGSDDEEEEDDDNDSEDTNDDEG